MTELPPGREFSIRAVGDELELYVYGKFICSWNATYVKADSPVVFEEAIRAAYRLGEAAKALEIRKALGVSF